MRVDDDQEAGGRISGARVVPGRACGGAPGIGVVAGNMTMKVGVQGRVILGPAGAPGVIEVPVRLALVQEGVEPKTIWTKGYRVAVNVPPGQSNVPFVHIEEDITFPLPKPAELD